MDLYEPLKLFKALIEILDSLLRQLNRFEDFDIMNMSKILLKFAVVFKIFEYFCPFLSLTIITGQRNFLGLSDGLLERTPERKIVFELFHCEMWKLLFQSLQYFVFVNYRFFSDWFIY